ncbi:MAG: YwbE family protein [Ignavibacteriales bacterium]
MNGQNRNNIKIGSLVDIVLKQDQRTNKLTRGHVKKILTNSSHHPHGIKVMIDECNAVGRVQKIVVE